MFPKAVEFALSRNDFNAVSTSALPRPCEHTGSRHWPSPNASATSCPAGYSLVQHQRVRVLSQHLRVSDCISGGQVQQCRTRYTICRYGQISLLQTSWQGKFEIPSHVMHHLHLIYQAQRNTVRCCVSQQIALSSLQAHHYKMLLLSQTQQPF